MTKTIRNLAIGASALVAATLSAPALAGSFLGQNFDCATADRDLARVMDQHQVPESAGLIPMLRHLMWMLEAGIQMLDDNCSYEPGYAEQRAAYVNTLNQAKTTCQQMASSPGECYAKRYN